MSKSDSKTGTKRNGETKNCSKAPCCVYDFTLFDLINQMEVRKTLNNICKKYCFQQELGEKTNNLHYQGRFSLKIKKRENEIIKCLRDEFQWKSFHLSITSKENRDNSFYVSKDETRVAGPFTDQNEVYIPKDVAKMTTLLPWQNSLILELSTYDERKIDIVYDPIGNHGKTSIVKYMMIFKDAEVLPWCNDYKDIMRMAYDVGPKDIYLIDMPRAISKSGLNGFFSGIETLKGGYCYDDRNKFRRRLMDRPRICIFTNEEPNTKYLSQDMWKIWSITDNKLTQYVPKETVFDYDQSSTEEEKTDTV